MLIKTKISIIAYALGAVIAVTAAICYVNINHAYTKWQTMEKNYNILQHSYQQYYKAQREFEKAPLKKVYATNKTILNDLKHGDTKYAIINIKAEQGAIKRELRG
jgi:uncharacterized membrane protein (DUF106 family)